MTTHPDAANEAPTQVAERRGVDPTHRDRRGVDDRNCRHGRRRAHPAGTGPGAHRCRRRDSSRVGGRGFAGPTGWSAGHSPWRWRGLLRCGMRGAGGETVRVRIVRRAHVPVALVSAFAGFRFPPEVIVLAVRWYLRFGPSCRDVEELLAERGGLTWTR